MEAMSVNAVHTSTPTTAARINWGPYLAGIGIGILSWIVFAVVNNPIGITTALSQVSGGVASLVVGADVVAANKYWAKNAFSLDYGTLFLVGTLFGGLDKMWEGRITPFYINTTRYPKNFRKRAPNERQQVPPESPAHQQISE